MRHWPVTDRISYSASGDTCRGDGGGPLQCFVDGKWVVYGISSHGPPTGCGEPGHPGIYAKVSAGASWIQQQTRPKRKVFLR